MAETFDDPSWARVARTVFQRDLGLRPGQRVAIDSMTTSLRPIEMLAREARRIGLRPVVLFNPDRFYEGSRGSSGASLSATARAELATLLTCDASVLIPPVPEDFARRDQLPLRERRAFHQRDTTWMQVLVEHRIPSIYLLAATATESAARCYGIDPNTWRRESIRAAAVDPRTFQRDAGRLIRSLKGGREVTIRHPNGTDLRLRLMGLPPVLGDGVVRPQDVAVGKIWTAIPSGFVALVVDDRHGEGHFVSNLPTRRRQGAVEGARWTFRNGRLRQRQFRRGGTVFDSAFRSAGPERDRPALVSIGLNREIHDFPLEEDLVYGVIGIQIGYNSDFGGRTPGSYREYALLAGADLFVDGKPIIRAGKFS